MRIRVLTASAALILASAAGVSAAEIEGSWSGTGYVSPAAGAKENVRCRVSYRRQSAKVLSVSASCATSSVKIVQTGEILEVGPDRYVGDFYNPQFDISGRVRVQVSGNRQSVTFSGGSGKGQLSLSRN